MREDDYVLVEDFTKIRLAYEMLRSVIHDNFSVKHIVADLQTQIDATYKTLETTE